MHPPFPYPKSKITSAPSAFSAVNSLFALQIRNPMTTNTPTHAKQKEGRPIGSPYLALPSCAALIVWLVVLAPVYAIWPAPIDAAPVHAIRAAPIHATPIHALGPAPVHTTPIDTFRTTPIDAAPIDAIWPAPIDAAPVHAIGPIDTAPIDAVRCAPIHAQSERGQDAARY